MPGDRLIELYRKINDARRDVNEAQASGDTRAASQAKATLVYLTNAAESILAPRPRASKYS